MNQFYGSLCNALGMLKKREEDDIELSEVLGEESRSILIVQKHADTLICFNHFSTNCLEIQKDVVRLPLAWLVFFSSLEIRNFCLLIPGCCLEFRECG